MRRRLWLVGASVLFAGWIGYLIFLAMTAADPVVLSRPQFLVADLVVVAEVDDPDSQKVIVKEVCASTLPGLKPPKGKELKVTNLRLWSEPFLSLPLPKGRYILPLVKVPNSETFKVAAIPPSPGFPPPGGSRPSRIYPATEQTLAQLKQICHER